MDLYTARRRSRMCLFLRTCFGVIHGIVEYVAYHPLVCPHPPETETSEKVRSLMKMDSLPRKLLALRSLVRARIAAALTAQ
jgi:hypothetical protein